MVRGFLGAYPNYFFELNERELPQFVEHIAGLKNNRADLPRGRAPPAGGGHAHGGQGLSGRLPELLF